MMAKIPVIEFSLGKTQQRQNKTAENQYQKPDYMAGFVDPNRSIFFDKAMI